MACHDPRQHAVLFASIYSCIHRVSLRVDLGVTFLGGFEAQIHIYYNVPTQSVLDSEIRRRQLNLKIGFLLP